MPVHISFECKKHTYIFRAETADFLSTCSQAYKLFYITSVMARVSTKTPRHNEHIQAIEGFVKCKELILGQPPTETSN